MSIEVGKIGENGAIVYSTEYPDIRSCYIDHDNFEDNALCALQDVTKIIRARIAHVRDEAALYRLSSDMGIVPFPKRDKDSNN